MDCGREVGGAPRQRANVHVPRRDVGEATGLWDASMRRLEPHKPAVVRWQAIRPTQIRACAHATLPIL